MAMLKKEKGHLRRKSWVLQFVTAFGLTFSVLCGFYGGYLLGSRYGWKSSGGVLGALVGLFLGLLGLIYLAQEETTRKK